MKRIEDLITIVESLPTGSLDHDDNVIHLAMIDTLKLCSETFQAEDRYDDLHFLVDSLLLKADKIKEFWYE